MSNASAPLAARHWRQHAEHRGLPARFGHHRDRGISTETAAPLVSVVIPIYNEEAEPGQALFARLYPALDAHRPFPIEIIFVNDGSRDNSVSPSWRSSSEQPPGR